jgi:hypothetical protein
MKEEIQGKSVESRGVYVMNKREGNQSLRNKFQ